MGKSIFNPKKTEEKKQKAEKRKEQNKIEKKQNEDYLKMYTDIVEFSQKLIDSGYMVVTLSKAAQLLETRLKTAVVATKKYKEIKELDNEFSNSVLNELEKNE